MTTISALATFKDRNGETIKEGDEPFTFRNLAIRAIDMVIPEDQNMSIADKLLFDKLARKIMLNDAIDLTSQEVTKLKDRIGKVFPPLIVGQAIELLDPAEYGA